MPFMTLKSGLIDSLAELVRYWVGSGEPGAGWVPAVVHSYDSGWISQSPSLEG